MIKYALSSLAREVKTFGILERLAVPPGRISEGIDAALQRLSAPIRGAIPVSLRGLPEGLDWSTLDDICRRNFGSAPERASHVHLTGWKASWVFRVFVRLESGDVRALVYKNAVYNSEHVPAVRDLPVKPGPPEYAVYRALRAQPDAALHQYVPSVYLADEVVSGSHYRYLIQDLGSSHRARPRTEAIERVVACLPELHRYLAAMQAELSASTLLAYDAAFREALIPYAHAAFTRYADYAPDGAARDILAAWAMVTNAYLSDEPLEPELAGPVHGDPNRTNVLVARDGSDVRLIDWEWAGIGLPHMDLAAVIKSGPEPLERDVLLRYAAADGRVSPDEHLRLYRRAKLERSLIDASFLAIQKMETTGQADFDIDGPLRRALETAHALT